MSIETFEHLPIDKRSFILSVGIKAFSHKSYQDVSTDFITKSCGISKGLLFHYFGSKKEYYLYCLKTAMDCLTKDTGSCEGASFYDILFDSMKRKISLCTTHPDEMHFVNMASREAAAEISRPKTELLLRYRSRIQSESLAVLKVACSTLTIKEGIPAHKAMENLHIYINAVINRYLLQYQQTPDLFFANMDTIKLELKESLDFFLHGICE